MKKITDFKTVSENIDNFTNDQQYLRRFENQLKVSYLDLNLYSKSLLAGFESE